MSTIPRHRMTADEFIAWSMQQPKGVRYELVDGLIVQMASERSAHALAKFAIARRLAEAVEAAGLQCQVYPDGMAVAVDNKTIYEPDAMVRCGEPLDGETVHILDPVIIVEVLSRSTQSVDSGDKLFDYFRIPSLHHYLLVRARDNRIVHHWRTGDGTINTRIHAAGPITLDPPGFTVDLSA